MIPLSVKTDMARATVLTDNPTAAATSACDVAPTSLDCRYAQISRVAGVKTFYRRRIESESTITQPAGITPLAL